jgi:hypothetical protein
MGGKAVAVIALAAPLALCGQALADEASQIGAPRYSFYKVADGFLRLDAQSGEVALCSMRPVGWACVAAPEDRAVLEHQIARLRKDNAALEQELLSRGLPLPAGVNPESSDGDGGGKLTLRLPSDADLDQLMALLARAWHRFVEAITDAQSRIMHKS